MYMKYITATELRTKTPQLLEELKRGNTVLFIHRSKVIGEFKPVKRTRKSL